jgi:hypothetical protein
LLEQADSDHAVEFGGRLIADDPSLARPWSLYVSSVTAGRAPAAAEAILDLFKRGPERSPWVFAWVCQPLVRASLEFSDELASSLQDFADRRDAPASMRARAVLALAVGERVPGTFVTDFAKGTPDSAMADVAAAAGYVMSPSSRSLRSIKARGLIAALAADKASSDPDDHSWL